MAAPLDLTGDRFGKLVALRKVRTKNGSAWVCRCDCGSEKMIAQGSLRQSNSTSCGCGPKGNERHGAYKSKLYGVWANMRQRCANPRHPSFVNYGARGIRVCAEWQRWESFRDWALANGYAPGLTLDREDNDGNYEPGNCRWATYTTQNRNFSRNRRTPSGEAWIAVAERNGVRGTVFWSRLNKGWPPEQAATWPLGKRRPRAQALGAAA